MEHDFRLVCDRCHAFRPVKPAGTVPTVPSLREDVELAPFVAEHEDCEPPLRITGADDLAIEGYREHYEEA